MSSKGQSSLEGFPRPLKHPLQRLSKAIKKQLHKSPLKVLETAFQMFLQASQRDIKSLFKAFGGLVRAWDQTPMGNLRSGVVISHFLLFPDFSVNIYQAFYGVSGLLSLVFPSCCRILGLSCPPPWPPGPPWGPSGSPPGLLTNKKLPHASLATLRSAN